MVIALCNWTKIVQTQCPVGWRINVILVSFSSFFFFFFQKNSSEIFPEEKIKFFCGTKKWGGPTWAEANDVKGLKKDKKRPNKEYNLKNDPPHPTFSFLKKEKEKKGE